MNSFLSSTSAGDPNVELKVDDLYLRDNQVRSDLDWRNVGEHKVDGVARRIRSINLNAWIGVRRVRLSGQESAASAASALEKVAACGLIIDATADLNAFNLLASVSPTAKKPMVWLEVFGGGIGGMVARRIPGVDETPQTMRNAYNNWCRRQAMPSIGAIGDYAALPSVVSYAAQRKRPSRHGRDIV